MATRIGNPYRPVPARSPRNDAPAPGTTRASGALGDRKVGWLHTGTRPTGAAQAHSGSVVTVGLSSRSIAPARVDEGGGKSLRVSLALALRACAAQWRARRDGD